jgi:copper(I)-binding protein
MHGSHKRAFARAVTITFFLPFALASASAHEFTLGPLKIGHPWGRATPAGAKVAGGYLTVLNTGSEPDRLLGGTVDIASRVEVHEMSVTDGIMRMRELPRGLEIAPGQKIELKPGSYHLMWMDISRSPKQGDRVKGTLKFERAGEITVEFQIDAIGSSGGAHSGHHGG